MNKEDLDKTLEHFHKHDYCFGWGTNSIDHNYGQVRTKGNFFHTEEDFSVTIFEDDDRVYQIGTEADTIGMELKTFEELEIRFKSFTGEEL